MEPYLTPLREGQQFQLCQRTVGISPYGKPPYGWYYNLFLHHHQQVVDRVKPEQREPVSPNDLLVASEVHWGLSLGLRRVVDGWWVRAIRPVDRREFGFYQYIDDDLWQAQFPDHPEGQLAEEMATICNVKWPDPSPESLEWATHGLINEQLPGSTRFVTLSDVLDFAHLPLEVGLQRALALLKKQRVPEPEAALRKRGFQV